MQCMKCNKIFEKPTGIMICKECNSDFVVIYEEDTKPDVSSSGGGGGW